MLDAYSLSSVHCFSSTIHFFWSKISQAFQNNSCHTRLKWAQLSFIAGLPYLEVNDDTFWVVFLHFKTGNSLKFGRNIGMFGSLWQHDFKMTAILNLAWQPCIRPRVHCIPSRKPVNHRNPAKSSHKVMCFRCVLRLPQVAFVGARGKGYQGDIAIDDVYFTDGTCWPV